MSDNQVWKCQIRAQYPPCNCRFMVITNGVDAKCSSCFTPIRKSEAKDNPIEARTMIRQLVEALKVIGEHYVRLASCGDCGFWNCEEEPEVIKYRETVATAEKFLEGK